MLRNLAITFFILSSIQVKSQWNLYPPEVSSNYYSLRSYDAGFYYAGAQDAFVYTNDGGVTWDSLPLLYSSGGSILATAFYDIWFTSPTTGFAVGFTSLGNQEIIFKTTNSGVSWTPVNTYSSGSLPRYHNALYFLDANTGLAVGTNGRILKTTNAGLTWSTCSSGTIAQLYDVCFTSSTTGYAVGANVILKTTNSGTSWSSTTVSGVTFKGVYFSSTNIGYAVGSNKKIYKTVNAGASWTPLTVNVPSVFDLYDVYFVSDTEGYVCGQDYILHTTNGGLFWEKFEPTALMRKITFNDAVHGYAAGYNGKMYHIDTPSPVYTPVSNFSVGPATHCNDSIVLLSNQADPANSYQWFLNDSLIATTYNSSLISSDPNQTDTVSLVAYNGTFYDTSSITFYTENSLDIGLNTGVLSDTICPGQKGTIYVYNSQSGVTYTLRQGSTFIGSQSGTGGTLTFLTPTLSATASYTITGTKTVTGCGTHSETNSFTFYMGVPAVPVPMHIYPATVCPGDSVTISFVSQAGTLYQLQNGATHIGPSQTGNGDSLFFSSGILDSTTTFNLQMISPYGCPLNFPYITANVELPVPMFTVSNYNPEAGESLSVINASSGTPGNTEWTFWPGASPITATTTNVSGLSFASAGTASIKLVITTPNGCKDSLIKSIDILPVVTGNDCDVINSAHPESTVICGLDQDKDGNKVVFYKHDSGPQQFVTYHHVPNDSLRLDLLDEAYTLVKYNSKGTPMWMTWMTTSGSTTYAGDVITDSSGNIIVTCYFSDFGKTFRIYSSTGQYTEFTPPHYDTYLRSVITAKFDPNGILMWYKTYLDFNMYKLSLNIDRNQDIYVCSNHKLIKYAADGALLWHNDEYYGFFNQALNNDGSSWACNYLGLGIKKIDASGVTVYNSPVIASQSFPMYIERDSLGDFYLAGDLRDDPFVFMDDTLSNPFAAITWSLHGRFFICKTDSLMNLQWIQLIHASGPSYISGFSLHNGMLALVGNSVNPDSVYLEFGPQSLPGGNYVNFLYTSTTDGSEQNLNTLYNGDYVYINDFYGEKVEWTGNSRIITGFNFESNYPINSTIMLEEYPYSDLHTSAVVFTDLDCLSPAAPAGAPEANFDFTINCAAALIHFTDGSTNAPTAWSWTFPGGMPSTSNLQNPVVNYAGPGSYAATLIASNAAGNSIAKTYNFVINPGFDLSITGDDAVCENQTVSLTASGADSYLWADGSTAATITFTAVSDTVVTVTGASGSCFQNGSDTIVVTPLPVVTMGSFANDTMCSTSGLIPLPPASPAGGAYFENGDVVAISAFNTNTANIGVNSIVYVYTSPEGCSASDSALAYVYNCTNLSEMSLTNDVRMAWLNTAKYKLVTSQQVNTIRIYTLTGQNCLTVVNGNEIDLEKMVAGIYLAEVLTTTGKYTFKLVR